MVEGVIQDLRHAARTLRRTPGFTLVAVLTLALGIGANSAIFSVVEAVLLRAPSFKEPERLVFVWERNVARDGKPNVVGPANFIRWRERAASFESLAGMIQFSGNVQAEGEPERIDLGYVTADYFGALGVGAQIGRPLGPDDAVAGHDNVVVLSHDYWTRRLAGDPQVLGKTLRLNDTVSTIVGVMPREYRGLVNVQLWTPVVMREAQRNARGRWMTVVGRLKPGVTLESAQAEMTAIAASTEKELPDFDGGWGVKVVPLREQLVSESRRAILLLFGAVGVVLLIAGANVANLLLARGADRLREMAVRLALGAPRSRLVRQLLVESTLLSMIGGAAGLLLALWAVAGFSALLPPDLARFTEIRMGAPGFLFAFALAALSGVAFGIAPALAATRAPIEGTLREGSSAAGTGRERLGLRHALVVAEMALSLVLLVGAGLLLKSFSRLSSVDAGVHRDGVTVFDISLPSARYAQPERVARFFEQAAESLATIPGVSSVGGMSWRLLTGGSATVYRIAGREAAPPGREPVADVRIVTPDLFRTLGVPLLAGRAFTKDDAAAAPKKVIVNQALARSQWPGEDPIGRHVFMSWGDEIEAEVVGVVGDVRLTALDTEARDTLYWSQAQLPNNFMAMMLRTPEDPAHLARAIKARIAALDPTLPVASLESLDEVLSDSLSPRRFTALLLEIFAGVALLLAALGNYGVLAYAVSRRRREIGIRVALGARAGNVVSLVLRQGMVASLAGVAIGVPCALGLARLMSGLLFEVSPGDVEVLVAVPGILVTASLLACVIPARRAVRVDPTVALRSE
ncbi:MAG: ABC transporter permease [Acidobacteria bacterium]|nr:ABC transporter permease [Acidobacteriota bacterium]